VVTATVASARFDHGFVASSSAVHSASIGTW
jgi:hypothetical protein